MPPDNLPPRWKKLAFMDKLIQRFGPTLLSISREQALEKVEKIETTRLQVVALNRGVSYQELKRREGWGNTTFVMAGNRFPHPQGNPYNPGFAFPGGRGHGTFRPRFDHPFGSGNFRGQHQGFRGGGHFQGYGNFRPFNPRPPHRDPRDQASSSQQSDNRNNQQNNPAKKPRGNFSQSKGRGRGGQNPQGF